MQRAMLRQLVFILALLGILFLHTLPREAVNARKRHVYFEQRDSYHLPPIELLRVLALNYSTFAASMTWIGGLIYYGDWRTTPHNEPPKHLKNYASTITALDPEFYRAYPWFNAVNINAHLGQNGGVPHDVLVETGAFLDQGTRQFPSEYDLTYSAGLNFLGYSKEHTPQERVKEYELGIGYFDRCLKLPGCPPYIALTRKQMYLHRAQLQAQLEGKTPPQRVERTKEELDSYIQILRGNSDPNLQKQLRFILEREGIDLSVIEEREELQRRYREELGYLSLDLWALVAYPTPEITLGPERLTGDKNE